MPRYLLVDLWEDSRKRARAYDYVHLVTQTASYLAKANLYIVYPIQNQICMPYTDISEQTGLRLPTVPLGTMFFRT